MVYVYSSTLHKVVNEFNAVYIFAIDLCSKHVVCVLMLHGSFFSSWFLEVAFFEFDHSI